MKTTESKNIIKISRDQNAQPGDMASPHRDRIIDTKSARYVVVIPAMYGGIGYGLHHTQMTAEIAFKREMELGKYPRVYENREDEGIVDVTEMFRESVLP